MDISIFYQLLDKQNENRLHTANLDKRPTECEIIEIQNSKKSVKSSRFDKNSLTDANDQHAIIEDMEKTFPRFSFNKITSDLVSLFMHTNNIMFSYDQNRVKCPDWFTKKYGE